MAAAEDPLTWRGHTLAHLSCGTDLRGENLAIGDRLFIAGETGSMVRPHYGGCLSGGAWTVPGCSTSRCSATRGQPTTPIRTVARGTHTTSELLALLAAMPDTATTDAPTPGGVGHELHALASIVGILAAGSWYLGRRWAARRRG